jgi:mannose-6-phosphate isomerase-like protein (cupin superfamily)
MDVANLRAVVAFTTKDGSEIREIAGPGRPDSAGAVQQSLAEAMLPPGAATTAHYHRRLEELYYVTEGEALLRLDGEDRRLQAGDCAVIPPGTEHKVWNTGSTPLRILCCCAPAYSHEDTFLTEPEPAVDA